MSKKAILPPDDDLPLPSSDRVSPSGTDWEVNNERAAVGLDRDDKVLTLRTLMEGSLDSNRVNTRGRVTSIYTRSCDRPAMINIGGETGAIKVTVEDDAIQDQLTEDETIVIRDLRVEGDMDPFFQHREFAIDAETEVATLEVNQQPALTDLAMHTQWPIVERVHDRTESEVQAVLQRRAEFLEGAFEGYGPDVSSGVRVRRPKVGRKQLYLKVSFGQMLLPQDIVHVARTVGCVDAISWMKPTYLRGIRYEVIPDWEESDVE